MRPAAVLVGLESVRMRSTDDLLSLLEMMTLAVLRGEVSPKITGNAGSLVATGLRTLAGQEVEDRLAACEQALRTLASRLPGTHWPTGVVDEADRT
jgi:hypothetical protein